MHRIYYDLPRAVANIPSPLRNKKARVLCVYATSIYDGFFERVKHRNI